LLINRIVNQPTNLPISNQLTMRSSTQTNLICIPILMVLQTITIRLTLFSLFHKTNSINMLTTSPLTIILSTKHHQPILIIRQCITKIMLSINRPSKYFNLLVILVEVRMKEVLEIVAQIVTVSQNHLLL
jgi:hypothetical protein